MRKVIALVVLAAATALSVASTAGAAPGQRGFHGHGFGGGISDGRWAQVGGPALPGLRLALDLDLAADLPGRVLACVHVDVRPA